MKGFNVVNYDGNLHRLVSSHLNDTRGSFAGLKERSKPTEELLTSLLVDLGA